MHFGKGFPVKFIACEGLLLYGKETQLEQSFTLEQGLKQAFVEVTRHWQRNTQVSDPL